MEDDDRTQTSYSRIQRRARTTKVHGYVLTGRQAILSNVGKIR